jgi:hypothetical protein
LEFLNFFDLSFFELLSHHASRTFLVSGQAQQALHFGFSPVAVVSFFSAIALGGDEIADV